MHATKRTRTHNAIAAYASIDAFGQHSWTVATTCPGHGMNCRMWKGERCCRFKVLRMFGALHQKLISTTGLEAWDTTSNLFVLLYSNCNQGPTFKMIPWHRWVVSFRPQIHKLKRAKQPKSANRLLRFRSTEAFQSGPPQSCCNFELELQQQSVGDIGRLGLHHWPAIETFVMFYG